MAVRNLHLKNNDQKVMCNEKHETDTTVLKINES